MTDLTMALEGVTDTKKVTGDLVNNLHAAEKHIRKNKLKVSLEAPFVPCASPLCLNPTDTSSCIPGKGRDRGYSSIQEMRMVGMLAPIMLHAFSLHLVKVRVLCQAAALRLIS